MEKKLLSLLNETNLLTVVCCYYLSKILWDTLIPVFFTIFFYFLIAIFAIKYIIEKKTKLEIILLSILFSFVIYSIVDGILLNSLPVVFRTIYEYGLYLVPILALTPLLYKVDIKKLSINISIFGLFICVFSWLEFKTKDFVIPRDDLDKILYYNEFRTSLFTRAPMSHGLILGILAMNSFYLVFKTKNRLFFINVIFALITILTTGSRGPLVASGLTSLILWFIYLFKFDLKKIERRILFALTILVFMVFIVIILAPIKTNLQTIDYFVSRIKSVFNWSSDAGNTGRIEFWEKSIRLWSSAPIFGVGPCRTGSWDMEYVIFSTESGILKRLVELGIIGLVLFYGIVAFIVFSVIKNYRKLDVNKKTDLIFFASIFLTIFIDDIICPITEETAIAFFYYFSLGGLFYIGISKDSYSPIRYEKIKSSILKSALKRKEMPSNE